MSGRRNIVLTGFMGSGKTSAGRLVAERLSRRFVDMDEVISLRLGMSVRQVFERLGETFFRQEERALCEELAQQEGLVIATGGGALIDPTNREVLGRTGVLICLTGTADTLWGRMACVEDRPLLNVSTRRERMESLLQERLPAYERIPHQVDTSEASIEEVAERVVEIAGNAERVQERSLSVHYPGGSYPIFITRGGLRSAGSYLRSRGLRGSVALITDDNVGATWGDTVWQSLAEHAFKPSLYVFPAGESQKKLSTVEDLVSRMVRDGLARDTAVVGLGGGVVGDTAGFVSAIYMRGLDMVQVPTTLLAMIDSSVGGKVAVDLPFGKNLVGAFKQPCLVLIDTETLATLPHEHRTAGLAEAVKHGVIGDPELFAELESGEYDTAEMLEKALQVKISIVEEDPYEHGRRAVLNLGHTFAHAFEVLSEYKLSHGEAVAIGMVLAGRLSHARGLCNEALPQRIAGCLRRLGLPTVPPACGAASVIEAMQRDKKKLAGRLRFVLPLAIGEVGVFDDVTRDELETLLSQPER